VTRTRGWEQRPVLSQRDTGRSTLEDQLPALIRLLEIDEAEAEAVPDPAGDLDPDDLVPGRESP
jgi:hypothetical protein